MGGRLALESAGNPHLSALRETACHMYWYANVPPTLRPVQRVIRPRRGAGPYRAVVIMVHSHKGERAMDQIAYVSGLDARLGVYDA